MKSLSTRLSAPMLISVIALFIALSGSAAAVVSTTGNANHLGGKPPSFFLQYRHFAYSHGEKFFNAGDTVVLGRNGHFTFTSTCLEGHERAEPGDVRRHSEHNRRSRRDGSGPRRDEGQHPYQQRRPGQHDERPTEAWRLRPGRKREQLDLDRRRRTGGGHLLQRRGQLARRYWLLRPRLLRWIHRPRSTVFRASLASPADRSRPNAAPARPCRAGARGGRTTDVILRSHETSRETAPV